MVPGVERMYKNMLVTLDGSELAEVVLSYARELSHRLSLNLIFFNVCEPNEAGSLAMHRAYVKSAADAGTDHLRRTNDAKPENKTEVRWDVAIGDPAEEILKYSEKNGIDLILMANHGRSGLKSLVIGSVANKVLRSSKVPVWLVRACVPSEVVYDTMPIRTVLVPLDGSILAESVLPHVEALVKQRGAELVKVTLLKVSEEPSVTSDYPEGDKEPSWDEHAKLTRERVGEAAKQYLNKIEKQLTTAGISVTSEVLFGKPSEEIINFANGKKVNLIMMATHAYSRLGQLTADSVADKVSHGASSPLFLVKSTGSER
jgi:nucleotide-binding universal stress UspA family protein